MTRLAARTGKPRISPSARALAAAHFAHKRLIAEADRLLAAGDVQIARTERVIERVRRELGT